MKTGFKTKKKFFQPAKNSAEEKNNCEKYEIADDSELLTISQKIIERNKKVYAELAK